jgi:hypothetical protein
MAKRSGTGPGKRKQSTSTTRKRARTKRVRPSPVITVRTLIGGRRVEGRILSSAPIVRLADEWAYLLRSRARWVDQSSVRLTLRDRALADLVTLGLSPSFIERLATVHHVEVELHRWNAADESANQIHEAAAAFPWEYLLSASTRGAGRFQPILEEMINDRR